ncbi:MAG: FlgD immunoglobulin-like domain containing protein [Myxococcota bacterium]
MTTGIGELAGSVQPQQTAPTNPNQEVTQDQFLTLLLTQLQNQSPLDPADSTEFVAQLAQFSSLEQLAQVNEGIDVLGGGVAGLINNQTTELIGRDIRWPGNSVELRDGSTPELDFTLTGAAETVEVIIKNEDGATIRTIELTTLEPGDHQVEWDGTDSSGNRVDPGSYVFELVAKDAEGEAVGHSTSSVGTVDRVVFRNGSAELQVGEQLVLPRDILEIL